LKPNTTEDILSLMDAHFTSAALGAAMELGLFWLLEERPLPVVDVAGAFGIPAKRCHYWLQLLAAAGLLERVPDGYATSPTARAAILDGYSRDSWALLADESRQRLPALRDLVLHIGDPGSALASLGLEPRKYIAQMSEDPDRARRFTRMLYELHRPLADELARSLDMSDVNRFMDLGGGSGVVSLALLRRHPHLTAVVADIANVCAAGREIAAENSLEDRISFHPGDFLADELPSGFEMILECDVNVYGDALFRKVRASLRPGGRFVIIDLFAPEDGVAPPERVHWAFYGSLADPEHSYPTAAEVKGQLSDAGFTLLSERTLRRVGRERTRFVSGLSVIEARR